MKGSLVLLLCALPLAAAAQIYRWVDANGVVHYSQTRPAQGPYEDVSNTLPASNTYNSSPQSGAGGKTAAKNGAPSKDAQQQALQTKADNAERCAKARERIGFLEEKTAHRLMVTGADGQPARMTDEQFNAELQDAKSAADKYCE